MIRKPDGFRCSLTSADTVRSVVCALCQNNKVLHLLGVSFLYQDFMSRLIGTDTKLSLKFCFRSQGPSKLERGHDGSVSCCKFSYNGKLYYVLCVNMMSVYYLMLIFYFTYHFRFLCTAQCETLKKKHFIL